MFPRNFELPLPISIQEYVRRNFIWAADKETFGELDYWTSLADDLLREPSTEHAVVGDCDDFAITCLDLCVRDGVPDADLRIYTCWTETDTYHCVSSVMFEGEEWLFDNRQRTGMYRKNVPYTWHKVMHLAEKGTWRVAE